MSCVSQNTRRAHLLFARIVAPHLSEARRLARRLTGNASDAEDVLQDASVRLFRFISTYRGGNTRAWVLRVVRNCAFSWLSANRLARHITLDAESTAAPEPAFCMADADPAWILNADQEHATLHQAIGRLPTLQREIIVLKHIEDRSYREIAQSLRIPLGTVMSRLSRAREATVQQMARNDGRNKSPATAVFAPDNRTAR